MIFQGIKIAMKCAQGEEFSLHRAPRTAWDYTSRYGTATVQYAPYEGGYALWASAALKGEGTRFDANEAMTLRFKQANVPYTAYYMRCQFWCRPAFGNDLCAVPARTQALIYREGGAWRVLWPLCGDTFTCTLSGGTAGLEAKIYCCSSSENKIERMPTLLLFSGKNPHTVLKKAAAAAEKILEGRVMTREKKTFPEIFEWLGWCSWDAMRCHISEEKLKVKAAEFKSKGIPVRWCILDDMWGHVKELKGIPEEITTRDLVKIMHQSPLYALEADPDRFPNGLKGAIDHLHSEGFKVGMWYPTTGYWKGLAPDGPVPAQLGDALITLPDGRVVARPTPEGARAFHGAMQDMLKAAGADFVKIDNQSHYRNFYTDITPVGKAAAAVQGAIEDVTEQNFGDGLINCMGMASESMFHRRKSAVSRCSGDFSPENRAWFAKHIQQCAYNSLFQGQFHYSDWDMWWTDDEQATKNALCHAVSGGPIYVSDKIDRSRPEVLKPLCFADGRILRADGQATPIARCILQDPTVSAEPLFVFNRANGCGVVAAFNVHQDNIPQNGVISAADLELPEGRYLVREQLTGACRVLEKGETLSVTLQDNDSLAFYLFYPLRTAVTPLGRIDKLLAPKAILRKDAKGVKLYEGGTVAFVGVDAIATDLRERVEGKRVGDITVFELSPEETTVKYL